MKENNTVQIKGGNDEPAEAAKHRTAEPRRARTWPTSNSVGKMRHAIESVSFLPSSTSHRV